MTTGLGFSKVATVSDYDAAIAAVAFCGDVRWFWCGTCKGVFTGPSASTTSADDEDRAALAHESNCSTGTTAARAQIHLEQHLADGQWHDDCKYCWMRRERGGTGVTATPVLELPALEQPCPVCTSSDYAEAIERAHLHNTEWHQRESSGYRAWVATREAEHHPNPGNTAAWYDSAAYEALGPEPELLPDEGCVECDWKGVVLTEAGRQLLAFLRRHNFVERADR